MDYREWCDWYKRRGAGRLRRLLMREWDPIGVNGIPTARDEYDDYLRPIAWMLRRDWRPERIADLLTLIRTKWMGCDPRRAEDMRVARAVRDWYATEKSRGLPRLRR